MVKLSILILFVFLKTTFACYQASRDIMTRLETETTLIFSNQGHIKLNDRWAEFCQLNRLLNTWVCHRPSENNSGKRSIAIFVDLPPEPKESSATSILMKDYLRNITSAVGNLYCAFLP